MRKVNLMLDVNDFKDKGKWEDILETLGVEFGCTLGPGGKMSDVSTPNEICITVSAVDVY